MTFALTAGQRSEIEALRDAMGQNNSNLGAAGALYDAIYEAITVNGSAAPGISHEVWTWIAGAKNVNAGIGSFAQLIRDNTARQWEIRYGTQMPQVELDKASNNIAYAVATDFLDPTRTSAPTLAEIGARDAGAVASGVFGSDLHPGEPFGNWAAWAGTILFVNLGYSDFFRNYLLNGSTTGREDTKSQIGTYDLVAANQAIQDFQASLSSTAQSFFENLWTAGSLWWNYGSNLNATEVEGNNWFKAQYGLDTRHAVTAGSDVLGPFDTATNALKSATWHAGTYGNDTLTSALSGGKDVLNAGKGDDTIAGGSGSDVVDGGEGVDSLNYSSTSLAYRYQVTINANRTWQDASLYRFEVEKIPALVSGPSSWDFVFNVEGLTLGQYADTVKFNGADIGAALTVDGGPGTALDTLDLSAMTRALTSADFDGSTVTIGGATFNGFERLIGTSKADTFILGSGGKTILGGEGLDTYVMGAGADKILDGTAFQHNGQGAIIDYRGSSVRITLKYTSPSIGFVGTTGWATGDEIMVSQQVTIHGTEQADHIVGRGWSQAWMYSNGDETVFGYGGADIIDLRSGNNYVDGGEGNDTITTAEGNDIVLGGDGDDVISVGLGSDIVYAEAGMDTILTLADSQVDLFDLGSDGGHLSYSGSLPGVFGNGVSIDLLTGTYQFRVNDTAAWQALNDTIVGPILSLTGSQNADALTGTNEADIIKGGKGRDVILGLGGDDKLFAPFASLVDGGEGDDEIDFGTGYHPWYAPPRTTVIGGTGEDFIFGNGGTVDIFGGDDNDVIQTWKDLAPGESFQSTFGTIRGGTGVDTIRITNGFTVFAMGDGDSITGKTPGQLNSTVNYSEALSGVTINGVTGQGSDYIPYMDHIVGSNFADVIYLGTRHSWAGASGTMNGGGGDDTFYGVNGSVFNQNIYGGSGNDVFYGGTAGSVFYGGADNDAMFSGTGKDVFHMDGGSDVFHYGVNGGLIGGQDIIHGFTSGQDKLFMPASMLVRRDVNDRDDDGDLNETFIQTKEEWFEEFNGNAYFRTAAGNPDMSNYVRIEGVPKTSLSVDDFQFI